MSANSTSILIIEDDPAIRRFLRAALGAHGHSLTEYETAADGLRQMASRPPDLVLLDLGLPDQDGLTVIRRIREWSSVPIIILSARGRESDKVAALDAGADDYLTKPFGIGELLARVRVAFRHALRGETEAGEPVFSVRNLRIDLARRLVYVDGNEIHLTPIEYRLLTTLVRYAGKVVTHQQLLKEVWGPHSTRETQYLRVYMGHLRHKLEHDPAQPRLLLTEPGVGYRLLDE